MSKAEKFIVTSALPYANGPIHLGHLAGAYLPADIFVRYHRLKGDDIIYICGSDEHGVPIILRARSEQKSPQEVVDYYHYKNKASFENFGISFDYYGRTSSSIHHQTSQEMFRVIAKKGAFVLKSDDQLYDPQARMFLADRFVRGTCPSCNYEEAYGDQCERCGISLSPADLIEPRSAITKAIPIKKESTHWYLPLAKSQPDLEKWIESHPEWKTNVLGQIRSWLSEGLKDRAVTRDLTWGVPVPEDIAKNEGVDALGKVLYVWFDAPIGYISATKEWAIENGDPEKWKEYWHNPDSRLIHFIGKDNIVFHCLIFPTMLMAHGDFILPENVPANEFLNLEGDKLSTSRNYAVWLDDYLKEFDPDPLRYCLASILPETRDTDFSWKDFQSRYNNELADIVGNFINRTLTFIHKNFEGKVPKIGQLNEDDQQLISMLSSTAEKVGDFINKYQIRQGLREAMDLARFANKYFNDQMPWKTINSDIEKCSTTLVLCLETIKSLSIILDPFIPFTTAKIRKMLNMQNVSQQLFWNQADILIFNSGHQLNPPQILFKKIEDEVIDRQVAKLKGEDQIVESPKQKVEYITIDDFKRIDLKVAEIVQAEKIPKTNKLLKLQVRLENEERQIIAGIAESYNLEDLIGKQVVIVVNLEPASIRGEMSNGMLLAANDGTKLSLISPSEMIKNGVSIS